MSQLRPPLQWPGIVQAGSQTMSVPPAGVSQV
jgi:hypothetical protein